MDQFKDYIVNPDDFVKDKKKGIKKSGCGSVAFCTQKDTNIKCVQKRTNEPLSNEKANRLFTREIETLVNCVHPAIIRFLGYAIVKNIGYIYLEEAENGSLDLLLKNCRKGKINPRFTTTIKFIISYGIARTMLFLHDQNRVHRDLKPGNILLDENLHPLLTDFGTAKILDNIVQVHQTLQQSTSTIMAPEFFENPGIASNSFPIDIYSYGMTLYELWTELEPFPQAKVPFQIYKLVKDGIRPEIIDKVPEIWKDLISKCWDQNSENRPTFKDIVSYLETDKYYTEDMDIAAINEYKKIFENIDVKSTEKVPDTEKVPSTEKVEPLEKVEESDVAAEEENDESVENPMLTKMRQDAEKGDYASQFNLVISLVEGTYGVTDYNEALKYAMSYTRRPGGYDGKNRKNTAIIEYYQGRCYWELGSYDDSVSILRQSDKHGCMDASFFLAELMFNDQIQNYNRSEMEIFYKRAADAGIAGALKKYAFIWYFSGFFGRPDKKKAIEYFKKGSEMGDPELMHMWSTRLEFGRDTEKDVEKAMELLKLACDRNYTPAMVDYGVHLLNGFNIAKDENQAKHFFQQAASLNDPYGQLWYYIMCKDTELTDTSADENIDDYLYNSVNSQKVPEAYAIYGNILAESGDIDSARYYLIYAFANGTISSFLSYGEICEKDSSNGDASFFFELAANYCHCLDECGFTTPMKYKVYHCLDCDKDICEGCAKHCHADHSTHEVSMQNGFKCQCGKDGFNDKCNAEFTGETYSYQHLYQCASCAMMDDNCYICKCCAEKCHKGHQITDCGVVRGFCSCGLHRLDYRYKCRLLEFEEDKCCSKKLKKQRWFQCPFCGPWGTKNVGICHCCAKTHKKIYESHQLLDLGVKEERCTCPISSSD